MLYCRLLFYVFNFELLRVLTRLDFFEFLRVLLLLRAPVEVRDYKTTDGG